jgi:hypothetical protein
VINDKLVERQKMRGPVAWNMAKAYAREVGISGEAALTRLFTPVEHHCTKITEAPSLAQAATRF